MGAAPMPFWRCYYHLIWATKNRAAWIMPPIETVILRTIESNSRKLDSQILAVNTVADHIHAAVCIPPKLAVAAWVKHMKGTCTRDVNAQFPSLETAFGWQQSYGVLTFGAKNQRFVIDYIQRQKEHHAGNTLEPYLEQIDDEN
jgi:REP element-mobilizing transposase RayT